MKEAGERAAKTIHTMAVSMAQLLDMHKGVELRWLPDEKAWHCEQVAPIVWFDSNLFGLMTRPNFGPWIFDDRKITLNATNGTWIWITTDRREHVKQPGDWVQTLHEARWPD